MMENATLKAVEAMCRSALESRSPFAEAREAQAVYLARSIIFALRDPTPDMVEAMRLCTIRNSRAADPARPFESPFTCAVDAILA